MMLVTVISITCICPPFHSDLVVSYRFFQCGNVCSIARDQRLQPAHQRQNVSSQQVLSHSDNWGDNPHKQKRLFADQTVKPSDQTTGRYRSLDAPNLNLALVVFS